MWVNPKYAQPEKVPRSVPEPSGRPLACFERPGRGRGPDTELRASLSEYLGHPFIDVRIWSKGPDGAWYPTRKGVSVRLKEAEDLAAALLEGVRLAGVSGARDGGAPRQGERRRGPGPSHGVLDRQGGRAPLLGGSKSVQQDSENDFDEFA